MLKKLYEEVKDIDSKQWRQSQMEKKLAKAEELFDSLSEKEKEGYVDIEGTPYFSYEKAWGGDTEGTYNTTANMEDRELFIAKHVHGELPTPKSDPLDEWESSQAVYEKEDAMTQEERGQYFEQIASDLKLEVHEIVSNDQDASIIDDSFEYQALPEEDKATYAAAVYKLLETLPATQGMPLAFEKAARAGEAYKRIVAVRANKGETEHTDARVTRAEVASIAEATDIELDVVTSLAASANAQYKILGGLKRSADFLLRNVQDVAGDEYGEDEVDISVEYITRFMRQMHIVGVKSSIDSATIGKTISAISLFDLQKVNTADRYDSLRAVANDEFAAIAPILSKPLETVNKDSHPVFAVLRNAHAKPQSIISAAKQVAGFDKVFEADAGNWEGYTLEEHTETVLRNFDENFADLVPVELLAPMRLALVVHDIGKPLASAQGQKHNQARYNAEKASEFMGNLRVDAGVSRFTLGLIGRGMELATQTAVFGRDEQLRPMRAFAREELSLLVEGDITEQMIDGYLDIAEMLVTCDGGAYTAMAVTQRAGVGTFRNAGTFDASFKNPVGPGKRDLALKHGGIATRSKQQSV